MDYIVSHGYDLYDIFIAGWIILYIMAMVYIIFILLYNIIIYFFNAISVNYFPPEITMMLGATAGALGLQQYLLLPLMQLRAKIDIKSNLNALKN